MDIYMELKLILNEDEFSLVAEHLKKANKEFHSGSNKIAHAELKTAINLLLAENKCKAAGYVYSYLKYCE